MVRLKTNQKEQYKIVSESEIVGGRKEDKEKTKLKYYNRKNKNKNKMDIKPEHLETLKL